MVTVSETGRPVPGFRHDEVMSTCHPPAGGVAVAPLGSTVLSVIAMVPVGQTNVTDPITGAPHVAVARPIVAPELSVNPVVIRTAPNAKQSSAPSRCFIRFSP